MGGQGLKMVCEIFPQQASAESDVSNRLVRSSRRSDVDLSNPHSMRSSHASFFAITSDLPSRLLRFQCS